MRTYILSARPCQSASNQLDLVIRQMKHTGCAFTRQYLLDSMGNGSKVNKYRIKYDMQSIYAMHRLLFKVRVNAMTLLLLSFFHSQQFSTVFALSLSAPFALFFSFSRRTTACPMNTFEIRYLIRYTKSNYIFNMTNVQIRLFSSQLLFVLVVVVVAVDFCIFA